MTKIALSHSTSAALPHSSNPPTLCASLPIFLSCFPPAISFFMLVLMPQTMAWPLPEMGPASLMPAPGELAVPAAQCSSSLWRRGHMPLTQLPVPLAQPPPRSLKKLVDITEREEERGRVFFLTILSPSLNMQ